MNTLTTEELHALHRKLENSVKSAKSSGRGTVQIGADMMTELVGALAYLSERVDSLESGKSQKSDEESKTHPSFRGLKKEGSTWDSMPAFTRINY